MNPLLPPWMIRRRGRRALRRLTPRQREIFQAYCVKETDYHRIADHYRISVHEVRADLVLALLTLDVEFDAPIRWCERIWPFAR